MAAYYEVDGYSAHGGPKMGEPLPTVLKERRLSLGETVVLVDSHSVYSEESGGSVVVKVLSSNEAKILVKTTDANFKPGLVKDEDKPNATWFGPSFWPENSIVRVRRQKTFRVSKETIFSNGTKRVEWRLK
jgi:hypothetical protein